MPLTANPYDPQTPIGSALSSIASAIGGAMLQPQSDQQKAELYRAQTALAGQQAQHFNLQNQGLQNQLDMTDPNHMEQAASYATGIPLPKVHAINQFLGNGVVPQGQTYNTVQQAPTYGPPTAAGQFPTVATNVSVPGFSPNDIRSVASQLYTAFLLPRTTAPSNVQTMTSAGNQALTTQGQMGVMNGTLPANALASAEGAARGQAQVQYAGTQFFNPYGTPGDAAPSALTMPTVSNLQSQSAHNTSGANLQQAQANEVPANSMAQRTREIAQANQANAESSLVNAEIPNVQKGVGRFGEYTQGGTTADFKGNPPTKEELTAASAAMLASPQLKGIATNAAAQDTYARMYRNALVQTGGNMVAAAQKATAAVQAGIVPGNNSFFPNSWPVVGSSPTYNPAAPQPGAGNGTRVFDPSTGTFK